MRVVHIVCGVSPKEESPTIIHRILVSCYQHL